jgi:hypothetical protein
MWVGLGGLNAPLEQVATTSACNGGVNGKYAAYYEMTNTPGWSGARTATGQQGVVFPVDANDLMLGRVTYLGNGSYQLSLHNQTKGWDFVKTESGRSDKPAWDTALWIVELPKASIYLPLANFGEARFTQCSTNFGPISDAHHTKIAQFDLSELKSLDSGLPISYNVHKASASTYTESGPKSGSEFTVKWRPI